MKYVQVVKTTVLLLALLVIGRISAAAVADKEYDQESYRSLNVLMQVEESMLRPVPTEIVCLIGDYAFNDQLVKTRTIPGPMCHFIKPLQDGKLIFLHDSGKYQIYDLNQGEFIESKTIAVPDGYEITGFDALPDDRVVIRTRPKNLLHIHQEPLASIVDLKTGEHQKVQIPLSRGVQAVACLPDNKILFSGERGLLYLYDTSTKKYKRFLNDKDLPVQLNEHFSRGGAAHIPQVGQHAGQFGDVAIAVEGAVDFWSVKTKKRLKTVKLKNKKGAAKFAILGDGATVILKESGGIYACNMNTKKVKQISNIPYGEVAAISDRSFISEEMLGGKENPILSLMSLRVGLSSFCIWERDALAVSAKEYEKYRASKMQEAARALRSKGRMPAGHASEDVALPEFCGS